MQHRELESVRRLLVMSICALAVIGCRDETQVVDRDPPIVNIAVGAEVILELTEHSCDRSPNQACLYERPEDFIGAEVLSEGVVELGEVSVVDGRTVSVTLRALRTGEATLLLDYRDFFGDRYHDPFILTGGRNHPGGSDGLL